MRRAAGYACAVFACIGLFAPQGPQAQQPQVTVPNYWDTRRKADKIDALPVRVIRFLVDDEYPPFHFTDAEGQLTGFSVDLARALCTELRVACTIQARRWDTLLESLTERRGDAIIAAMKTTPEIKERFRVTGPYHRSPARFVTRLGVGLPEPSAGTLIGRKIAVVQGSAHEAFLRSFFAGASVVAHFDTGRALSAVKAGEADYAFADGVAMSLWLNGTDSGSCCAFRGGPYLEPRYFGEGVGVILRQDDRRLARALDQALAVLADRGVYTELYLKYFPVSFY